MAFSTYPLFNTNYSPIGGNEGSSFHDSNTPLFFDDDLISPFPSNTFDEEMNTSTCYYDISHIPLFSIWDTGFMGYSELNILLQNHFINVATITKDFSNVVGNLSKNDILFLGINVLSYNESEINQIVNFVNRGGNLLIIGEHYEHWVKVNIKQNDVLENFGMKFYDSAISDEVSHIYNNPGWNLCNSSYFSLNNISFLYGTAINLMDNVNSFSIINASNTAKIQYKYDDNSISEWFNSSPTGNISMVAGYEHPNGKGGKVVAMGDSEIIWNGDFQEVGIHAGNNSKFFQKLLDWFYEYSLSEELENGLEIVPEYSLFSSSTTNNFSLNISISKAINITTEIEGGTIYPTSANNINGRTSWEINVTDDGYVKFHYNITTQGKNTNFSQIIPFFKEVENCNKKILFLENNYSRSVGLSSNPDGFYSLARSLKNRNYSVFSRAINLSTNLSQYKSLFLINPLQNLSNDLITHIKNEQLYSINNNLNSCRLIFLNMPYSSLNNPGNFMASTMKDFGFSSLEVPINKVLNQFGLNFSHFILYDDENNAGKFMLYNNISSPIGHSPRLLGANNTFYNLTSFVSSIVEDLNQFNYVPELIGYNSSWGDSTTTGPRYFSTYDDLDLNSSINPSVMVHNESTLASGLVYHFTNQYFDSNSESYFDHYFFNWIEHGQFNKKYSLVMNSSLIPEMYFNENVNFTVTSPEPLKNLNGDLVPNGTIFNAYTSMGEILTDDLIGVDGYQIIYQNNSLELNITTLNDTGFNKTGLFEICLYNSSNSNNDGNRTDYPIILSLIFNITRPNNDFDNDGMPDNWEIDNNFDPLDSSDAFNDDDDDLVLNIYEFFNNTDPQNDDTDDDGLLDGEEINDIGTNPLINDTDGDTLLDLFEHNNGLDPLSSDTDNDGLSDGYEFSNSTLNPLKNDTDDDGMPDLWEVIHDLIPNINDSSSDYDADSLVNYLEFLYHTNPNKNDTDEDGLTDGYEIYQSETNPNKNDTDGDGLTDGYEIYQSETDPKDSDTDGDGLTDGYEINQSETDPTDSDTDGDGLTDGYEINQFETDPNKNDTDGDGMPDGWEVENELDPSTDDSLYDPDDDGLVNIDEYTYNTDPQNPDTDNDGYSDSYEVIHNSDPNDPDDPSSFKLEWWYFLIAFVGIQFIITKVLNNKKHTHE